MFFFVLFTFLSIFTTSLTRRRGLIIYFLSYFFLYLLQRSLLDAEDDDSEQVIPRPRTQVSVAHVVARRLGDVDDPIHVVPVV